MIAPLVTIDAGVAQHGLDKALQGLHDSVDGYSLAAATCLY
jgi:hypothetical protein